MNSKPNPTPCITIEITNEDGVVRGGGCSEKSVTMLEDFMSRSSPSGQKEPAKHQSG
jgi:hypothetical protein